MVTGPAIPGVAATPASPGRASTTSTSPSVSALRAADRSDRTPTVKESTSSRPDTSASDTAFSSRVTTVNRASGVSVKSKSPKTTAKITGKAMAQNRACRSRYSILTLATKSLPISLTPSRCEQADTQRDDAEGQRRDPDVEHED